MFINIFNSLYVCFLRSSMLACMLGDADEKEDSIVDFVRFSHNFHIN